jgi:UDP-N-acetylmuramate dehydrogenase
MNMADLLHFVNLRGELRRDEPMARHVSWRAGGTADRYFAPADLDDLQRFLRTLPEREPLLFVGLGSNLLVRDGGFRGTVVSLHAAKLHPDLADGRVHAAAGVAAPKVARFAARHDLAGAEFLAGIPGTVGGALAMNAGCYDGETWRIVDQVQTIDRKGALHLRGPDEYEIGYRHCRARSDREEWFVAAWFRLPPGDGRASQARIKEFLGKRIASQPLQLPNAGSVFRNPEEGKPAARLIQFCGLKKLEKGGARVSDKHANFIVNPKGAGTAADIEWLILEIQRQVEEESGIRLTPEVKIVGEPA